RYFTASVQSTSCNEGENLTLKCLFGSSSLSLYELFDALEKKYQEKIDLQIRPKNAVKNILDPVVQQLNEFVMPNIIKKQKKQMSLSFYYHAMEVDLEVIFSKEREVDESEQCIDNLFDFISNILTSLKVCILLAQFLDNEFSTNRVEESANCVSSQLPNEISKAISKKCKFNELWGLGRKAITDAIEDNNKHIYHELLRLFTSIQKKTLQKIINNISVDGFNNSTNNNSCILDIQNPIKRKSKGCPKSKRIANTFEKSNTVMNYKCKIYKQSSHNSQTCKEKNKEDINADNADEEFGR
ncbi:21660_t:CDS:2, partial [Gigaspora margarita]